MFKQKAKKEVTEFFTGVEDKGEIIKGSDLERLPPSVQKGDKIAIMSFNTPAFVIAFFGALKAGAAVVPVNHKLAAPEVDYILEHSDARALLFDGALSQIANNISVPIKMAAIDSDALVATPCRVRTSW
jgi:acyl-CoA synthetase (AMP-forming)/AMP-acid ligase II